jgi:hypothetical protein
LAKFPEPPTREALLRSRPDVEALPAGTPVWRVYFQAGAHPTTWDRFRSWGPTTARFDHMEPPPRLHEDRAILYAAIGPMAGPTTLAEVFQASRTIERFRRAPALVAWQSARELRLLDLRGTWPTRAGASAALCCGPRRRARRWAQAIHAAWPEIDGLLYASSMNGGEPAVALWERADDAVPRRPVFHRQLGDPAMMTVLRNAARELGYRLQ